MYGIKYGVKITKKEIQEQAIKNAEKSWNCTEVQESLKKSRLKCDKLEKLERQKDEIKLVDDKIRVINWLNNCLETEFRVFIKKIEDQHV